MKARIIGAAAAAALAVGTALGGADVLILLGQSYARWLTSTKNGVTFSSQNGLKEAFDLNRDFYVELIMRLDKSDPGNPLTIGSFGGMTLRYLRGPFQLKYDFGGGTKYCFSQTISETSLRWPRSQLHHVILMSVGHVCRMYVDGDLLLTEDWSKTAEAAPWSGASGRDSKVLSFAPSHEIRLYRVGYLACEVDGVACAGEDAATLVATHYNNGNPIAYEGTAPTRLVDMRQRNFRMTSALNPVSGKRLLPAAALEGTLSWRTDDPYARSVDGTGAPTRAPRYAGQYYAESETGRHYVATGNRTPVDWRGLVYDEDIRNLSLKTLGGVSLFGTGDIVLDAAEPYREVVDVTASGAVGDGETDDTAAIAEALRLAKAGGKGLYFPVTAGGGTYRISAPLALDGAIRVSGAEGAALVSEGTVLAVTGSGVQVADLAIASGMKAVSVTDAELVRFERVTVRAAQDAIVVSGATDVWIEDADIVAPGMGVKLVGSHRVSVVNGSFAECSTGVYFSGGNTAMLVTGNLFANCGTGVGSMGSDADILIAQNVIDGCASGGLTFAGGMKRVNVKGNVFRAMPAGLTPIVCQQISYSAISDNVIRRVTPNAMEADILLMPGCNAVTVGGNVMDGRIETSTAKNVALSGNLTAND